MSVRQDDVQPEEARSSPAAVGSADAQPDRNIESHASPGGEILVVRVAGDVDVATISDVEATLTAALDRRPAHVVVDLAAVTFCGARGLGLLEWGLVTANERGIGYVLSGYAAHIERIWVLLSCLELPVRHRSVAAAVTAIRAGDVAGR